VWTWDEPLRLLSISDADGTRVNIPLESLQAFAAKLRELGERRIALLIRTLEAATNELETWCGSPAWPPSLADAIGLLLMFILMAKSRPQTNALVATATWTASHFPPNSPSGAWRAAYQKHLPFAYRAGALETAAEASTAMATREQVWWTAKCRLDLAITWAESRRVDDAEAVRTLVDAATDYIRLLKDEPCRRALEGFYTAAGTTSEKEVLRAHAAREEHSTVDDVVRGEVLSWMLRRYALAESWTLLKQSLTVVEKMGAILGAALTVASLFVFLLHTFPRTQVVLQIVAFISLVFLSPRVFSLLLPRGMFGTLLAWIMVVLAQTASLLPIVPGEHQQAVHREMHQWLAEVIAPRNQVGDWLAEMFFTRTLIHPPPLVDFLAIVLVCLTISVVFLMVEVAERLSTRVITRAIFCVLVMLGGSLFWGAMLVPTLQYIVVREPFGTSCACIYPAWLLGSVGAVAFGILVQLMWDEHAISESLAVPLREA
jgi:hypothetical protein